MSSMLRPMEQFVRTLLAARRVSTPLVSIRTADPALTISRIEEAVGKDAAIVQWDIVRGLVRVNDAGTKEIGKVLGERDSASVGPVDALVAACQLGEDAVLVFANAQRFWNDPQVAQAIWNLRDVFKANGRTLMLLTTPGAVLPDELTQDVLVLDEPLPAVEDLTRLLEETMAAAEVPELESDASGKAVDALLGLARGLLDLGLPGFDGYALARRIRAHDEGKQIYLVALTGYGQSEDRLRSEAAGFDDHVVKPLDGDQLARLLQRAPR